MDPGPNAKFSLKMTKYIYMKIKKWEFDKDFFGGPSSQIIWQLYRAKAAKLYGKTVPFSQFFFKFNTLKSLFTSFLMLLVNQIAKVQKKILVDPDPTKVGTLRGLRVQ